MFEKRYQQLGRIKTARLHHDKRNRDEDASGDLEADLSFTSQPQISAMHDFDVVIAESDSSEGGRGKNGNPYEPIAQVRP